jgi:hypothetical protein
MKHSSVKFLRIVLGISTVLSILGGCGGGSSGASTAPTVAGTDVPVSATQQSPAALAFVKFVVAKGEANQEDPLVIGGAVLAGSESDDPEL